jgi:transposase
MHPYSLDLRQRIVAAVNAGMSRSEVVRSFQVSAATIRRYLKHQRETGDLTAGAHTGGRQAQIGPQQYPALQEVVAAAPDATLAETCQQWQQRTAVLLSQASLCRALAQIGLKRKKRH